MPLIATRGNAAAGGYGWSLGVAESLDGMVLMTPTSISSTGTGNSSSIGANGSVTFSSCATLSLNGVFTADYDNYLLVMWHGGSGNQDCSIRFRSSGTDNSTASSYVTEEIGVNGTGVSGNRNTRDAGYVSSGTNQRKMGTNVYCYGPYLAQATAWRTVAFTDYSGAAIFDYAGTHNQTVSYDGLTIIQSTGLSTGLVSVYGLEN